MDVEIDLGNIEKGIRQLFTYAFITNCSLDEESITSTESKTLEELDQSEVLENLKDLVLSLLKFKSNFKSSDKLELVTRTEQFETLLQKHEAEIRNHIRIEHQLKLHIENSQHRIDELEKAHDLDKNYIEELEEKYSKKGLKNSEFNKGKKSELEEKIKSLLETIEKKEKNTQKVEYENMKLRTLLEEKAREFELVKKELGKLTKITPREKDLQGSKSEYFKHKIDIYKSHLRKEKSPTDVRQQLRSTKRSLGETEFHKLSMSPYTKKEYSSTNKKEETKSSAKIPQTKRHLRTISDQKFLSSKRTPSR